MKLEDMLDLGSNSLKEWEFESPFHNMALC
jgi:hypothetical protein